MEVSREEDTATHWMGSSVGPGANFEMTAKRKIDAFARN
jgi:hypothetical protein